MEFRRVATGHGPDGRSRIASDEVLTALDLAGMKHLTIWGGDRTARFPDDGSEPDHTLYFPKPGGFRVITVEMPPASAVQPDIDPAQAQQEMDTHFPGMLETMSPDAGPGMHRSATIDFLVVLEGEVVLLMEEGEVTVRAGDVVVQNGTMHSWANRSDRPARMLTVLVGAEFDG